MAMDDARLTRHLRMLEPADGILAFYDGRIEGHRFAAEDNWVDDGALSLGIASYALVEGDEALVYDTHISVPHARAVRSSVRLPRTLAPTATPSTSRVARTRSTVQPRMSSST